MTVTPAVIAEKISRRRALIVTYAVCAKTISRRGALTFTPAVCIVEKMLRRGVCEEKYCAEEP